jgi:biopolymer transport protein ExbD
MSESQVTRFVASMEEQGVGVTRTKKGLFLRLPDKTSTTVHFTNSDVRAFDNLIARLRRAGVRHPEDPKNVAELPSQIVTGKVADRSKRRVMEAMEKLNYPDVVRVMPMMQETGMEHVTVARTLYALGFKPIAGKRNSRDWLTPDDIMALKPKPPAEEPNGDVPAEFEAGQEPAPTPHTDAALMEFVGRAQAAQAAINDMGMGNPQVSRETSTSDLRLSSAGREFIDTHDSWVVDLTRLPLNVTIGEYLQSLDASGLEFEVRVWRRA